MTRTMTKKSVYLNLFIFYVGWWSVMLSQYKQNPIIGWVILAAVLIIHFYFVAVNPKKDAIEVLAIGALGYLLDTALLNTNVLSFNDAIKGILPPLWLAGIWILFAITISYSFILIRNKVLVQIIVGGLFAPVSYITGAKLNLLGVYQPIGTYYLIHGACWVVFFPLCFFISKKIKGF